MKKGTKILLIGTVVAVAGYIAYSSAKNKNEKTAMKNTVNEVGSVTKHSTDAKEFVERRKQRAAEKRAAREELENVPVEQKETVTAEVVCTEQITEIKEDPSADMEINRDEGITADENELSD